MHLPRRLIPAPALLLAAAAGAQGPADAPPDAFARTAQLVEQGEHEMRVGDMAAAERSFLNALQAARVTHGLSAPEQRPVLRRLIAAQLALEKWGEAAKRFGYFEWVNESIYERHFYEYLRGTRELGRLLLDASAIAGNPQAPQHLEEAKNLYWRAVTAIEATLGEEHIELAPWLYEIVLTHHYRSAMSRRSGLVPYARDARGGPLEGWTQPRTESLRVSHRIGRELLQRIQRLYESAPQAAPEAAALVQLLRGDWAMLYGHADDALALYRGARDLLMAAGFDDGQVDLAFAGPVALPVGELVDSWEKLAASRREGPVRHIAWSSNYPGSPAPPHQAARTPPGPAATLRFDLRPLLSIPVRSNAQDLRLGFQLDGLAVTGASPDTEALRTQALRDVSRMVFRPRLAAGTPVGQSDVALTYRPPAGEAGGPAAGAGG